MPLDETVARLEATLPGRVCRGVPFAEITTYRLGGPAAVVVRAGTLDDIEAVAAALVPGVPVLVAGRGSNLLVADGGFAGVVVTCRASLAGLDLAGAEHGTVRAGAGLTLPALARQTAAAGLGGLLYEFLSEHELPPVHASHYARATAGVGRGEYDYAVSQYRLGTKLRPDLDEGFLGLAAALETLGDRESQVRAYEDLLAIHPRHRVAHSRLAEIHQEAGRLDRAIEHLLELVETEGDNPGVHYNLGVLFLKVGRPADAEGHLFQTLRSEGESAAAWNNLGVALAQQGKREPALDAFMRAVERSPEHVGYRGNLDALRKESAQP